MLSYGALLENSTGRIFFQFHSRHTLVCTYISHTACCASRQKVQRTKMRDNGSCFHLLPLYRGGVCVAGRRIVRKLLAIESGLRSFFATNSTSWTTATVCHHRTHPTHNLVTRRNTNGEDATHDMHTLLATVASTPASTCLHERHDSARVRKLLQDVKHFCIELTTLN